MNDNRSGKDRGFGADNWATLIASVGQGIEKGMAGGDKIIASKKEAKEAKRRTLADMLNRAMKRDLAMYRTGQEYQDETRDYQSQAMQQVAKGFVDALRGTTLRGRV